jgi:hypothetical protein
MGYHKILPIRRSRNPAPPDCRGGKAPPGPVLARADCLEQLLEAFHDIIDRDDIHQAARRLSLVQEWIRDEAEAAAADPIFADWPAG